MDKEIIVSIRTLLIFTALIAIGWVVLQIYPVILALYVSMLLTLTLTPLIDWAQKRNIPRGIGTALLYIVLLSLIATVGVAGIRPITSQMNLLMTSLPQFMENSLNVTNGPVSEQMQSFITGNLNNTSNRLVNATMGIFSNVFFIISILVFTFYLLVEFDEVKRIFVNFFPPKYREPARNFVSSSEQLLGSYMRGQLLLGTIVGVLTFIGLKLLNIEFALSLAIFAGVLEMVPMIGPLLSAIPALIVAIPLGPWPILGVAILYTLIQQTENNFLVPKVMQRSVGLNPLITLILLLTGASLFGVVGILLAVPTALVVYLIVAEFFNDIFEIENKWVKKVTQEQAERE